VVSTQGDDLASKIALLLTVHAQSGEKEFHFGGTICATVLNSGFSQSASIGVTVWLANLTNFFRATRNHSHPRASP
jgi:hypothetical protein